jgi:hypothetical protein
MKLKCFESTDSNGTEQYLVPLEDGSFIAIPKERISCLMMVQGIDCEECPRRFTCHELPTIKPKHGKWIEMYRNGFGNMICMCSKCNFHATKSNFCPNCGADMRKGAEDEN